MKLWLSVYFPTDYLEVLPPIPVKPEDGWKLNTKIGEASIFSDDWDVANEEGRSEFLDTLHIEVALADPPTGLLYLENPAAASPLQDWINSAAHMEAYNTAMRAGARPGLPEYERWMEKRAEFSAAVDQAAEEWLGDVGMGPGLRDLASALLDLVRRLLEILRVHHGQVVIPDPPRFTFRSAVVRFADDTRVALSREVLYKWLDIPGQATQDRFGRPFSSSEWLNVASRFEAGWKPSLVETLLANARSECERQFGNPRVAVLEAATVVEILIKVAMGKILLPLSLSQTAIDRIVRDTATADLVNVWLRPHLNTESYQVLTQVAAGIHERNELLHHSRRNVSFERAEAFVHAVGTLAAELEPILAST